MSNKSLQVYETNIPNKIAKTGEGEISVLFLRKTGLKWNILFWISSFLYRERTRHCNQHNWGVQEVDLWGCIKIITCK